MAKPSAGSKAQASVETKEPSAPVAASSDKKPWLLLGAAAVLAVLFFVIYLQRLDHVVGLIVDDAWYVLLAKALATGQGYTLINSPTPGIQPFYPPFFPFLLSLLYRLSPNFPSNLWLLKSLSIAAMFGAGALSYFYFHRQRNVPRWVALGIAGHTALYPALVFLATSAVMSECLFTFIQLAAIVVIERCVSDKENPNHWRRAALGGVIVALAVLTRSAGWGLVIGGVLYLFKEKLSRAGIVFIAVVAVIVGPWMLYSRAHAATLAQRDEQRGNIVQPYSVQLWQKVAGQPASGIITGVDLPDRVINNLTEITRYDIGGLAFYPLFRPLEPGESIRVGAEGRGISYFFAALALFGFIMIVRKRATFAELMLPFALMTTLLWGWEQFRLLLPLTPFVIFYVLAGTAEIIALFQKLTEQINIPQQWFFATALVWICVATNVYSNFDFIDRKNSPSPASSSKWIRSFNENEALIKYVAGNLPKDAVLASQNPALVHLYTGHKTVAFDEPATAWENWKKLGLRYVVQTSPYALGNPTPQENRFRIAYRQEGAFNLRVLDLGEPSSRPNW